MRVEPQALKAAIVGSSPNLLQQFLEPTEIANLVLYLASPLSTATNGAALRADGGVFASVI
jgi:NAD(P)-dependent dehydrogenase (short-subunit alcohol dehydrogenase family)